MENQFSFDTTILSIIPLPLRLNSMVSYMLFFIWEFGCNNILPVSRA